MDGRSYPTLDTHMPSCASFGGLQTSSTKAIATPITDLVLFSRQLEYAHLFNNHQRSEGEYVPKQLAVGEIYDFCFEGRSKFWANTRGMLYEREESGRHKAVGIVRILSSLNAFRDGKVYTFGKYELLKCSNGVPAHFSGHHGDITSRFH